MSIEVGIDGGEERGSYRADACAEKLVTTVRHLSRQKLVRLARSLLLLCLSV